MDSAFLKDPVFAWFNIIFALAFGAVASVAMVLVARRDPTFLGGRYLKALAGATALAIGVPALTFLTGFMTPTPARTLAEAYLLGGGIVGGWTHVLLGYALWVGVAAGGLLALLLKRPSEEVQPEPKPEKPPSPRVARLVQISDKAERVWPLIAAAGMFIFMGLATDLPFPALLVIAGIIGFFTWLRQVKW
jgi:hypothetical protein